MEKHDAEVDLRQEAIRRRLEGERRCDICQALGRGRSWFDKWWTRYRQAPGQEPTSHSRAPHRSSHKTSSAVEQAVVRIRRAFEAAQTAKTRYGLVGHRAIRAELERLAVGPLPSLSTIQRILHRHDLTRSHSDEPAAYYPTLPATRPNAIHATDIITRHLRGGQVVQNFHTFDICSHDVHLTQAADKRSTTACQHLLATWADMGLPWLAQFDNEDAFSGGHTHGGVLGLVVRLCLFVGVEPIFIPFYEAKRNHWVEGFHGLWVKAFWSRKQFTDLKHVRRECPRFLRWYRTRYTPPSLCGHTPSQRRDGFRATLLTDALSALIPDPIPLTAGFIHFIRKVDADASIRVLNQPWRVGQRWIGQYVWARIDTAAQTLTILNKARADTPWKQIKVFRFPITQPVHRLLPQFRRKCPRCPEHWLD